MAGTDYDPGAADWVAGGMNAAAGIAAAIPSNAGANTKALNIASGILATIAPYTGPAAAALLVIAPGLSLIGKIFHGADPRQVPASKIEQAFEAAAKNLYALAKAGMITVEQALTGMQSFLQTGLGYYTQMSGQLGKAGEAGKVTLAQKINEQISKTSILPATTAVPLDLAKAHALYIQKQPGWYDESVDAATQLTDQYLQSLPVPSTKTAATKLVGLGLGAFAAAALIKHFV